MTDLNALAERLEGLAVVLGINGQGGPIQNDLRQAAQALRGMVEVRAWAERMATWLEQQAARHEEAGRDERFKTLSDARKADARNYRKMAADARSALKGGDGLE